jgi:hypothetical protein
MVTAQPAVHGDPQARGVQRGAGDEGPGGAFHAMIVVARLGSAAAGAI